MPNRLVFFGTEDFSLPFLSLLIEEGYQVAAVVTKPDSKRGRSGKLVAPAVKELAKHKSIEVLQPAKLADISAPLAELKAEAGFLAAYGRLIPDEILKLFSVGIINVHPSDLPRHRGPSPIEQTILDGDKTTAVSLIKLVSAMDAGPVYAKASLDVPPHVTKAELTDNLVATAQQLVKQALPDILAGKIEPQLQDESQATYTKLIQKSDGLIDWSQPAIHIERQVRAYQGWPGSYCDIFNVRITIHSASVSQLEGKPGEHFLYEDGSLGIYCGQGALIIRSLQPAGRKTMSSADFVRGYSL